MKTRKELLGEIGLTIGQLMVIDWEEIAEDFALSEEFMREFQEELPWDILSSEQTLSESFIEEFGHKVYWDKISRYQKLSEAFIQKYLWELDKIAIFSYQELSIPFIEKYKTNALLDQMLQYNPYLTVPIILRYASELSYIPLSAINTEHLSDKQREDLHKALKLKKMFVQP